MQSARAGRVMFYVGVFYFVSGLVFASLAFVGLSAPALALLDALKWPVDGDPGALGVDARWLAAIGGGVLAAFGAMTAMIVAPGLERGDGGVRNGAVVSILVWFFVDSAGSVAAGVPSNAAFNVPFLLIYLAPLVAWKPDPAGAGARPAATRAG